MFQVDMMKARDIQSFEDAGLFPSGTRRVDVQLIPRAGETRRGDWVVSGYLKNGKEVQVVFAGRRVGAARQLRKDLSLMWVGAHKEARLKKAKPPVPQAVRLPVAFEAGWRPLFRRDEEGCETREFQLIAARWTYVRVDGIIDVAGEPPRCDHDVSVGAITNISGTAHRAVR